MEPFGSSKSGLGAPTEEGGGVEDTNRDDDVGGSRAACRTRTLSYPCFNGARLSAGQGRKCVGISWPRGVAATY